MARAAKPITWPYLRTGSSAAIAATAILWPRGTRSRAVVPATALPAAIGSTATTTLSSADRRLVRGVLIGRLLDDLLNDALGSREYSTKVGFRSWWGGPGDWGGWIRRYETRPVAATRPDERRLD